MAETAYQRTMKDMRLAGLNPILAYRQGATQAGQGAMAQTFNPDLSGIGSAMEGMQRSRKTGKEVSKVSDEKRLIQEQTNQAVSAQQVNNAEKQKKNTETELLREQIPGARAEGDIDRSAMGPALRKVNRASSSARGLIPMLGK